MNSNQAFVAISQQIDKLALYSINRRLPDSFEHSHSTALSLDTVLQETQVDEGKTALYALVAPGEHVVNLHTPAGPLACRIRVRLAQDPKAPLILYHHGLAESPYYITWQRLFPKSTPVTAHTVAIQAPFHNSVAEAIDVGFASVQNIYQMFAGSLRLMEATQAAFESQGAAYTIAGGVSWGGITSLLFAGLFQSIRAAVPLFAGPHLSIVLQDAAKRFNRPIPIEPDKLDELLDFTPLYRRYDEERVFAMLGRDDLFFVYEHHAPAYAPHRLVTVPSTHVGGVLRTRERIRQRLDDALAWAASHPC